MRGDAKLVATRWKLEAPEYSKTSLLDPGLYFRGQRQREKIGIASGLPGRVDRDVRQFNALTAVQRQIAATQFDPHDDRRIWRCAHERSGEHLHRETVRRKWAIQGPEHH